MAKPRVGVRIKGLARFRANMRDVSDSIREGVVQAVHDETLEVTDDMREHAPVDTGNLVELIHEEFKRKGLRGQAVSSADYTKYVVHGTSTHDAQDFMTPAALRSRQRFPDRVADQVRAELNRKVRK